MNRWSTPRGFLGQDTILYNMMMVDTCHYTFVKSHRSCGERGSCRQPQKGSGQWGRCGQSSEGAWGSCGRGSGGHGGCWGPLKEAGSLDQA